MSVKTWHRGRIALTVVGVVCITLGFVVLLKTEGTYLAIDFFWGLGFILAAIFIRDKKEKK